MIVDPRFASNPPRLTLSNTSPFAVVATIVVLVLAPVLVKTVADPDLWGHVRFGLDMLQTRSVPRVDPYSFTHDVAWIDHEWLSELLMGVAYRLGGPTALSVLRGALVTAFAMLVLPVYARSAAPFAAATALLVAGTMRQTLTFRPQLWTLIGIAVLCRLVVAGPRRCWWIAFPLLFLVWANVHGGWIVGAGLLAMWCAFRLADGGAPPGFVLGVAVLSALATLVNPYGWRLWTFLGATVRLSRPIAEWQPLVTAPAVVAITLGAVLLGVVLLAAGRPRPPLDRLAIIAALAYGAYRVERLAPICVTAALVLIGPAVTARWPARPRALRPLSSNEVRGLIIGVAALAAVSCAAVLRTGSCIVVTGEWIPDGAAGRALTASGAAGRLVPHFAWGEYAIWHFAPRLRVSIDGRRETVYSEAILAGHEALEAAAPEGLTFLQQLDPTYVWEPANLTMLRDWLATHGYRIDVQTDASFVAVRSDQPVLERVAGEPRACFPGP